MNEKKKGKTIFEFAGDWHTIKEKKVSAAVCTNCKHGNNMFQAFISHDKERFYLVCNLCGAAWKLDKENLRRKYGNKKRRK